MRLATWNVNSLNVRLPHVIDWLKQSEVDVLCLQELKQDNDKFPENELNALGYHSYFNGQKTYNGVAIVSKYKLNNVRLDLPNFPDDTQKRFISADYRFNNKNLTIISAYIPNGQSLASEKFKYKLIWLKKFIDYLEILQKENNLITITGDFNIAPENIDCHDPEAWDGQVLVSDEERQMFQKILNLGFFDAFRLMNPDVAEYSWWDYRQAGFRRNLGMRIDHILLCNELKDKIISSFIDKNPRKLERPSDHTPVVVEI